MSEDVAVATPEAAGANQRPLLRLPPPRCLPANRSAGTRDHDQPARSDQRPIVGLTPNRLAGSYRFTSSVLAIAVAAKVVLASPRA